MNTIDSLRRLKWRLERLVGERSINRNNKGFINFIDVGAAGWLPNPWRRPKNAALIRHLLRIEPSEKSYQNENVITLQQALWKNTDVRNLYLYAGDAGGASLLEQDREYVKSNYDELRKQGSNRLADTWFARSKLNKVLRINCASLVDILQELNPLYGYHFLKIDAQGAEYEILKGAEDFLIGTCVGIQAELFVLPVFKDIKLLPEVVGYLRSLEFDLVKKYPAHGSFNSACECVFIKRNQTGKLVDAIKNVYELLPGHDP